MTDAEIIADRARIALGNAIAEAIRVVSSRFWDEWGSRYPGLSETRKWELQTELAGLIEAARLRANPPNSPALDRFVASGPTDPGSDTLIEKVESLDGTVAISEDTVTHKVNFGVTPASTNGGKLWTGWVQDRLWRPSVDAVFYNAPGAEDPTLFASGFTQISTGVWQRILNGPFDALHFDGVAPFVGMRVMAWHPFLSTDLNDPDRKLPGPYVLLDTGETVVDPITHVLTDHYVTFARAGDCATSAQVYSGIWFTVLGGTAYGGTAFHLVTADPIELETTILDWELVTPPTPAPTKELLTASQLGLAYDGTTTATVGYVSVASGELELVVCTEHDAVLGGTVLPGTGPFRFHVLPWLTADDPYATTMVNCYVRGNAHTPWVLVATTQPLHNTSVGVFVAVGTLGSDYALGIGEKLQARYTAVSNSVAGVIVNLTYNDPQHKSYIEIPAVIGYAGTDDHNQLINRFWRGNPTPELQHDAESVDPPEPAEITTVAGFLTLPSKCTTVVQLMGTEPLLGISTREGNYSSIPLTLFIMQATTTDPKNPAREPFRVLTNEADMTGYAGFSAMNFGMMGMGPAAVDNEPPNYELTRYSCLQLICLGGNWWPVAPAFVYQSP
jgi:hypothetical protein